MMLKVLLTQAACELAAAVISNLPDTLAVDPEITNPETKAENLMAYRVAHIFYDGLCRALDPANPQAWQTPEWVAKDTLTGSAGGLGQLAQGLLSKGGPLATMVGELLPQLLPKLLGTGSKPITGNIPSPADVASGK